MQPQRQFPPLPGDVVSRGPSLAGASDPAASELVEEGEPEAAGSGQPAAAPRDPDRNEVLYTWDDGGRTRRAWLQTDLAVQPSTDNASDDVVVRRGDSESIVKRQAGDAQEGSNPVFRTASGALMTLPGGVLLLLDPEWDQAGVYRFFFENAVAKTRVSDREFGGKRVLRGDGARVPSERLRQLHLHRLRW